MVDEDPKHEHLRRELVRTDFSERAHEIKYWGVRPHGHVCGEGIVASGKKIEHHERVTGRLRAFGGEMDDLLYVYRE